MAGEKILVVIPAYNEEKSLRKSVEALVSILRTSDILIVNDGSLDGTQQVAASLARELPALSLLSLPINSGIGITVQTGLLYARSKGYDYVIQYDGDGQHDPVSIPAMLRKSVEEKLDLCVGSRFLKPQAGDFLSTGLRRVGIQFFSLLISSMTGIRVTDPTSGFRVYGKRAIDLFSGYYPDDYPEPEALFWCVRNGLRVGEVPARMHERAGGKSSIQFMGSIYYMIKVTVAILVEKIRSREMIKDDS